MDWRPEDLPRYALALRRLAGELVSGAEQRDELVQSTFAAALERPPRALSWTWLAAALRNRARDLARGRARRGEPTALHEAPCAAPDAVEVAQRLELQEDLARALRALAEPYQSTLYLRYFEDLGPAEIARRTGTPEKTVKTRLERGLALLRARLEPRYGPGARGLVALLAPFPERALPELLVTGGLGLMWKSIALAAAAVLVLAFLWRSGRPEAPEERPRPEVRPALAVGPAPEAVPDSAAPPEPARVPRETSAAPQAGPRSELGALRVRVRWSDGTPAPSVALDVRLAPAASSLPELGLVRRTSDADGMAVLEGLAPGEVRVQADRGASVAAEIVAGEVRECELTLAPGLTVAGRVLDPRDAPVAGAEIWLTSEHRDWLAMSAVAVTDAGGRFRVRDVPAGQSLGATARGHAPSALLDLDLVDALLELELRLGTDGGGLAGRVLDARGAPAADAVVCVDASQYGYIRPDYTWAEGWGPRHVRCDSDGRFVVEGLPPGELPVAARVAGEPPWSALVTIEVGRTRELEIRLPASAALAGVVRDASGAPVARAFVRAFPQAAAQEFLVLGHYGAPTVFGAPITLSDADGRYRLAGVWAGATHAYASPPRGEDPLRPEVHAEALLAPRAGETLAWDPVLEPGHVLRGRARWADGAPIVDEFVRVYDGEGARRTQRTDTSGGFTFYNLAREPYRIEVQLGPPGTPALSAEGVFPDGPVLELVAEHAPPEPMARARVRGRFDDPLARFARPLTATLETSLGVGWFPLRSDAQGFEFTEIPAGRYRLMGSLGEHIGYLGAEFALAPGEELDLGTVLVPQGHALRLRLDPARGLEDVVVSGTLRRRDTIRAIGLAFTDGVCTLTDLTPGTYVLQLDGGERHAAVQRELELTADAEVRVPVVPRAE
ncbi:MAG TPA: sigma-70 family RNA polymerase sigma factor [Planctomycetota bacterium]